MTTVELKSDIDVELIECAAKDEDVVHAARVSTLGQKDSPIEDGPFSLINYLMKHRHGTPFEHNFFKFFVRAPIFVWREWHRHRIGFSYNEESGRYKTLEPVFYIPPRERPMFKVEKWKPGRPKFLGISETDDPTQSEADYQQLCKNLKESYLVGYDAYLHNLKMGFDPGLARDCLPLGIYSSCYVTCNARSLMSFLSLRVHAPYATFVSYPLYEIDVLAAQKLEAIFAEKMPATYRAFVDNGRVGP